MRQISSPGIGVRAVADWKRVARRAWSVRLAVLATVLSAAEVAMQLWAPQHGGRFAALAGLVSLAAGLARLVAQPKTMGDGR